MISTPDFRSQGCGVKVSYRFLISLVKLSILLLYRQGLAPAVNVQRLLNLKRDVLKSVPTVSMRARDRHVLHVDTMYSMAAKYATKWCNQY